MAKKTTTPAELNKAIKKFMDAQNIDYLAHQISGTENLLAHKFIVDPVNGLGKKVSEFEAEEIEEMNTALLDLRKEMAFTPPKV